MSRCWDILHMVKYDLITVYRILWNLKMLDVAGMAGSCFIHFPKMILPRPYGSIQLHAWWGDEKLDMEEYEKLVRKAMPGTVKWWLQVRQHSTTTLRVAVSKVSEEMLATCPFVCHHCSVMDSLWFPPVKMIVLYDIVCTVICKTINSCFGCCLLHCHCMTLSLLKELVLWWFVCKPW